MKETPKVKNPTAMLVLHGVVIAIVLYWYYQVIALYRAGGEEAPSLSTVILGGVVLGGGCILIGYLALRIYRQEKARAAEIAQDESESEDPAE